jgi:hypothetical protein
MTLAGSPSPARHRRGKAGWQRGVMSHILFGKNSMKVFQVLPAVLRRIDGEIQVDVDFYEALEMYLEHFDSV